MVQCWCGRDCGCQNPWVTLDCFDASHVLSKVYNHEEDGEKVAGRIEMLRGAVEFPFSGLQKKGIIINNRKI